MCSLLCYSSGVWIKVDLNIIPVQTRITALIIVELQIIVIIVHNNSVFKRKTAQFYLEFLTLRQILKGCCSCIFSEVN